jgi:membrane protease YdiL (CAAX protease family)
MMQGGSIMKRHPSNGTPRTKSPWVFFVLVFAFSLPFWLLGPVAERFLPKELPVDLPLSSLMALAPVSAAVVLVRREEGADGVKTLLKRIFDYKKIKRKAWYLPILFLNPAVMVLQYGLMVLMGVPLPAPQIPVLIVSLSFVVFFIAALGEEVGWQGYAIDPLQERRNALRASVILGIVWAAWHIVPMIQLNRMPTWIAWQCMSMVVMRILVVWLYNNTGKSVFATILVHAMNNVTTVLLFNYGWPYDPFVAVIITAVAAAIVSFLWGPKTLAQYQYARRGRDAQTSAVS